MVILSIPQVPLLQTVSIKETVVADGYNTNTCSAVKDSLQKGDKYDAIQLENGTWQLITRTRVYFVSEEYIGYSATQPSAIQAFAGVLLVFAVPVAIFGIVYTVKLLSKQK